jgi:hypothetical protein
MIQIDVTAAKPLKTRDLTIKEEARPFGPGFNGRTTEGTLGRLQAQWQTMLGVVMAAGS